MSNDEPDIEGPDGTGDEPHPAGPWGTLPEDATDDEKWLEGDDD
jgi:hypothetical protein